MYFGAEDARITTFSGRRSVRTFPSVHLRALHGFLGSASSHGPLLLLSGFNARLHSFGIHGFLCVYNTHDDLASLPVISSCVQEAMSLGSV